VIAESAVRSFPIEENKEPQVCQSLLCNLVSGIGNCGRAKLFGSYEAHGTLQGNRGDDQFDGHTPSASFERNNTISLVQLGTYPCPERRPPQPALLLSFKPSSQNHERNCSAYKYNLIIQPRPRTVGSAHKFDRDCHTSRRKCLNLNPRSVELTFAPPFLPECRACNIRPRFE
jgi:hypothetical protein